MLTGLPGKVIATGKGSLNIIPIRSFHGDLKLESYRVVEVTLPCPMTFSASYPDSGMVAIQRFWRVEVTASGDAMRDRMTSSGLPYMPCVDGTPMRGGLIFDPAVLREGATIGFGDWDCAAEFSEKMHFAP